MDAADPTSLDQLLRHLQSRDERQREAAWAECYQRFHELVWTRVFYVLRSVSWLAEPREVAQDVTSEVFMALPETARLYRSEGKAEQWLSRVAVRAALRARERLTGQWNKGAKPAAVGRRHESFDEEADRIAGLADSIDREELLELERRLARLRESSDELHRRWAAFIDLYREGFGFDEIGKRMNITAGTARNWLVAIRKHLASPAGER